MKCKYEIESILPSSLSFENMKEIICQKIVRIIILEENNYYGNK